MRRYSTVITHDNLKFCFTIKCKKEKKKKLRCPLLVLEMSNNNTHKVKSDVQSYFRVQIISAEYISVEILPMGLCAYHSSIVVQESMFMDPFSGSKPSLVIQINGNYKYK